MADGNRNQQRLTYSSNRIPSRNPTNTPAVRATNHSTPFTNPSVAPLPNYNLTHGTPYEWDNNYGYGHGRWEQSGVNYRAPLQLDLTDPP